MRVRGENEKNIMLKCNVQLVTDEETAEYIRLIEKYLDKNTEYEISEKFDNLDDGKLRKVYDVLCDKLNNTIYKARPSNKGKDLLELKDNFVKLNLKDKAKVCDQTLNMLRCDIATTSDLKLIGGTPTAGGIAINKNTLGKGELVLVNQSVTGIFENRIKL